ncbi:glycerate kinase [Paraburkholderia phenoliruptrix]|uniref:glycerate kinase n=1 Tax=Paraburkholderia phenoliruptrix TaxID=252970 RepID=UPI002869D536|nr:glycerate kinase [Paraburkholderia phenoliruptrix]WMY10005.1 glycerate kinase [Paraburkholderia phenoliruptrix]
MKQYPSPIVVIAPDSFKGSLSAEQVARAIAVGVQRALSDVTIRICPMADGGEGTLAALMTKGGLRREVSVRGADGGMRDVSVGMAADGAAIIETAEIVGITDPVGMSVPVEKRSSQGLGEVIRVLLDSGVRGFLIGLGGTSTNDGGAGLLAHLGLKLFDSQDRRLDPTPEHLLRLARVDASGLDERLQDSSFVAMTDVNSPLTGRYGATAVFGPQKGVKPEQVDVLDALLGKFADLVEPAMNRFAREKAGAGAAGGLGFALHLLGASFEPGAEVVARHIELDAALQGADWLITGEGRSDNQTLQGKAPFVACSHARELGVPATLLSGAIDPAALSELAGHFTGCFSSAPGPISLERAMRDAAMLLSDAAEQMARLRFATLGDATTRR